MVAIPTPAMMAFRGTAAGRARPAIRANSPAAARSVMYRPWKASLNAALMPTRPPKELNQVQKGDMQVIASNAMTRSFRGTPLPSSFAASLRWGAWTGSILEGFTVTFLGPSGTAEFLRPQELQYS